ncbi:phage antirepressor Ant [Pseudoxanthomonas yeongjuensis]|uniref:antA/AntB antirepressor family protein n=1 Tax=Pseudoxanthomonas yeongjuensis TaxID=377616 RepID=UPI001391D0CD|nr:antA/AntB antirepressor family protein [Pseudoxanthomonas yeongjuensis]KAF1717916.1 phage antirepressor Ant [Pseudoxanthomonas yeongjuensis]
MRALIPLQQRSLAGEAVQTVNARDLHVFLRIGRDFSTWLRARIEQYGFVENGDFVCSSIQRSKQGRGGHNRLDYHLTIDMAKELAMVERSDRGKEARQYFLECERRAQALPSPLEPTIGEVLRNPEHLRDLLLGQTERVLQLEATVAEHRPQVAAMERMASADGDTNLSKTAKVLGMQPMTFIRWLADKGWIYRRGDSGAWTAYQPRLDQGVLVHRVRVIERTDGTPRMLDQVMVTPKGISKLAAALEQERGTQSDPCSITGPTNPRN